MGERPDELTGPYDSGLEDEAARPIGDFQNEPVYDESGTITADTYDTGAPQPVYVGDASDTYIGDVDADSDSGDDDDLEATRQQIEQTRSEMSNTIDAIQNKLSPSNMVQEAKDSVRDATVGRAQDMVSSAGDTAADVGGSIVGAIKQNPVPAALAGISLGWLIMSRQKSTSGSSSRNQGYGRYVAGGYPGGQYRGYQSNDRDYAGRPTGNWETTQGSDQGTVGRAASSVQGAVSNTVNQVQNTVGNTMDQVQGSVGDAVDQAQSSVGDAMNQAQSMAGDAVSNAGDTASDIGSTIVETIRQNPIPAAMTGIGLGWLITKMSSGGSPPSYSGRSGEYSRYAAGYPSSYRGYQSSNWDYQSQPSGESTMDQARQSVGQAADQVQGTVSDTVNQMQDSAGQVANQVQSQVSQLGSQTQQAAQQATSGFQAMMQSNPLAVGAAAVAVGMAIGLAVPETSKEDELMGDARADLTDRAQQMVQDTAQKVQTVAQEAVGAAKQEAQDQNLM